MEGRKDAYPEEQILQDLLETIGPGFIDFGRKLLDELFRLRVVGIEFIFLGVFFGLKVPPVQSGNKLASLLDTVLTGLLVRAIDETLHEIVVCADARSVVGVKACHDGIERKSACVLHPFGNAGLFGCSHEQKGSEHAGGVSWRSPMHGRVEAVEQGYGRIEVQVGYDGKLLGIGDEQLPELITFMEGEKTGAQVFYGILNEAWGFTSFL